MIQPRIDLPGRRRSFHLAKRTFFCDEIPACDAHNVDVPNAVQIPHLTIGSTPGPRVLIIAGVHGDEHEPMAAVRRVATLIDRRLLRGTLTLAPCVNEPAFRRNARTAEDGLDLARICPGDAGGSISHQVAQSVSAMIRSHDFFIDLHTGGVLFELVPLAGYVLHGNPKVLAQQRSMARALQLPVVWGTTPTLDGRTLSVARDANIPAIYGEYGGGGTFNPAAVDDYARGCVNVLRAIGVYDEPPAPLPASQAVIEDGRDRAGFLQVQHPSPVEGFFEPAIALGQTVRAGQPIGRVIDPLGATLAEVAAAEDGLAVMLRAWRHVAKGDALLALASSDGVER